MEKTGRGNKKRESMIADRFDPRSLGDGSELNEKAGIKLKTIGGFYSLYSAVLRASKEL
jgi:hypothetical protein